MLPVIFVIPLVQLIILVNAATLEMKEIKFQVVDKDLSSTSRKLVSKFVHSPFYTFTGSSFDIDKAMDAMNKDKADMILHVKNGFEKQLFRENDGEVQVYINAINGMSAGIMNGYAQQIIMKFNKNIRAEWLKVPGDKSGIQQIRVTSSYWYNPGLNYKVFMVPAVLVILVTMIGMILSSLNLVREKEIGTIEQLNVTPVKKYQFIAGKLIPFWILALLELSIGLIIGKLLFHIPIEGSLFLLYGVVGIYLVVVLGFGLLVSTLVDTQQQAMFINFFFMLVFILMSGVFTPVESMPEWGQQLNLINPIYYLMKVTRMVLLKGSEFVHIRTEVASLTVYALIIISLATWRYRKVA
jgi:ABC-2 type transport system permease protein